MKTLDEQIAVMTAYKNGARVERRPKETTIWLHCNKPSWDWEHVDYRVVNTPIMLAVQLTHEGVNAISSRVTSIYNPDVIRLRLARGESMVLKFVEVTDGS